MNGTEPTKDALSRAALPAGDEGRRFEARVFRPWPVWLFCDGGLAVQDIVGGFLRLRCGRDDQAAVSQAIGNGETEEHDEMKSGQKLTRTAWDFTRNG